MVQACCTVAGIALRALDKLEERNNFTTIIRGTTHVPGSGKKGKGEVTPALVALLTAPPSKRQHLHISSCGREKNYPSQRHSGSLSDTMAISTAALGHLGGVTGIKPEMCFPVELLTEYGSC